MERRTGRSTGIVLSALLVTMSLVPVGPAAAGGVRSGSVAGGALGGGGGGGALGGGGVAAAAPVVQPALRYDLGAPELLATSHRYDDVPIPVGITELTIEYGPEITSVDCYLMAGFENVVGYRHDDPVAERDVIDIDPGAVTVGDDYELVCRVPRGEDHWQLTAAGAAATTATVSAVEPTYLTQVQEQVRYGDIRLSAAPEQRIAFYAVAGALPTGRVDNLMIYSADVYLSMEGAVAAPGARAVVTMPFYADFAFTGDPGYRIWFSEWSITGRVGTVDGVPLIRSVVWHGLVTVLDMPSAIKVAVSSTTATSFQQVKAIVQVSSPNPEESDELRTRGRIVVKVDGVEVKSTTLYYDMDGRWIVSLPKQTRGDHVVTAEYSGWNWLAPSTSNRTLLRILV